jgi:NhaA family Na+:H+ antiporter
VRFVRTEAGGGVLLLGATVVALLWANGPWHQAYHDLWHTELRIGPGRWAIHEDLRHWVTDGLMAVFFFVVGLEIKGEVTTGGPGARRSLALPTLAALGGMVVPALLFLAVVGAGPGSAGWGIPMATDIAFAVGVLSLLGSRVPSSLKSFLLTLAVVDDIGAIVVIAVVYSQGIALGWLAAALLTVGAVVTARWCGVRRPIGYFPLALACWYCTYQAGIHPTIAAVALGLLVPGGPVVGGSTAEGLEARLHAWSSYVVVPLFALANAGIALSGAALAEAARSRVTWAVAAGLFVGKATGITAGSWVALRSRVGRLPSGARPAHIVGTGGLGGIGFTVSLFITNLAFTSEHLQDQAKVGILFGSTVSAVTGVAVLLRLGARRRSRRLEAPG